MPDSVQQSLKTDAQRAEELRRQSKKKDNLDPEIAEYFNKKAEEFQEIMKNIEKVKAQKLA